jgi:hypothetical protein
MKIRQWPWQQDLGGGTRTRFLGTMVAVVLFGWLPGDAGADQSFAVALPELEGPVTMGIFSQSGERVRLLYRDATVDSIPAGLNGLIMNWDGKNDQGEAVPAGIYKARGIVHGPLGISALPQQEIVPSPHAAEPQPLPLFPERPVFSKNSITIRAARDELLESRPLLSVEARLEGNACVISAEGLPLLSIPITESGSNQPPAIELVHGTSGTSGTPTGSARLKVEETNGFSIYTISGLDRLVPLNAGALEVRADAFHPMPSAGESAP